MEVPGTLPVTKVVKIPRSDAETCALFLESALLLQHLAEREAGLSGLFVAPGLLIFAARASDAGEQARLQARVTADRDFQTMALAVARSLRESAREQPELLREAARVQALARGRSTLRPR
jgi:hypothetical protein